MMPRFEQRRSFLPAIVLAIFVGAAVNVCVTARAETADDYPSRPVRIYVGYPAGSGPDGSLRIMAQKLQDRFGKPFIVENVSGSGGNFACERAARAQPDGYTLVLCTNGALAISPSLYTKMNYDPQKDLDPIIPVFIADNLLVVPTSLGVKSVSDLVALAKKKPGEVMFGHGGVGSTQHLGAELFRSMAGIDIRPIAYRGATAILPDLLSGRIQMSFANIANAYPMVAQGQLIGLATAGVQRSPLTPQIPTMSELGFKGFDVVPWYGLLAPAGTPKDILSKLEMATREVLASDDVRKQFQQYGFNVKDGTHESYTKEIRAETVYWAKFMRDNDIKVSN